MSEYNRDRDVQPGDPGAQPYQGAPPPPPAYGAPTGGGVMPGSVKLATNLLFVAVGLNLLGILLALTQRGAALDAARQANTGLSEAQLETAVNAGMVTAVVIGLIMAGVFLWLTFMVRAGKNWARITSTVLLVLAVLFGLIGLGGTAPALTRVLSIIQLLLYIVVLFLLWQRPSSDYFRARS